MLRFYKHKTPFLPSSVCFFFILDKTYFLCSTCFIHETHTSILFSLESLSRPWVDESQPSFSWVVTISSCWAFLLCCSALFRSCLVFFSMLVPPSLGLFYSWVCAFFLVRLGVRELSHFLGFVLLEFMSLQGCFWVVSCVFESMGQVLCY